MGDGILGSALRGAIIGGIVGLVLYFVMQASKKMKK
jgi:hypothetical protein